MALSFAAVLNNEAGDGDALIRRFAQRLQDDGWQVRGLVTQRGREVKGRLPMQVADLHTGDVFDISQSLGRESQSCSLDPNGLAQAGSVLRRALEERPDLVIVNRFGTSEAAGRGFSAEILALISAEIPVLVLLNPTYLEDWLRFSGDEYHLLPPHDRALDEWASTLPAAQRVKC